MTRLHACSLSTSSEANSPSTSKDGKFASLSYACLMRSKNAARMMHPPFQILAISPKFNPHSCSFDLALIKFMPCAYEVTFDAYNALRTSSINCFLSIPGAGPLESAGAKPLLLNTASAATRSSFKPDKNLESKLLAIVGAATDNSAACCTVHLPVPFMPVLSKILSTKKELSSFWSSFFSKM